MPHFGDDPAGEDQDLLRRLRTMLRAPGQEPRPLPTLAERFGPDAADPARAGKRPAPSRRGHVPVKVPGLS